MFLRELFVFCLHLNNLNAYKKCSVQGPTPRIWFLTSSMEPEIRVFTYMLTFGNYSFVSRSTISMSRRIKEEEKAS